MLDYLKTQIDVGRNTVTIMNVGGNMQVSLKVQIESFDEIGIVARVKGMMGGYGEPKIFPWPSISSLSWD